MSAFAGPVASAAWILARAAGAITGTRTATVIYGEKVRPITRPGHVPAQVTEFTATDGTEKFCQAIDALDDALDLSRPGAARLLVIVSDGQYIPDERAGGQQRITRLARSGCGILWLAPDSHWSDPMDHAQVAVLDDPAATAERHRPRRHPRPDHPRHLTRPAPAPAPQARGERSPAMTARRPPLAPPPGCGERRRPPPCPLPTGRNPR